MHDVFQGEWARRLCHTDKKDDLAKHYLRFYELCARRHHDLTSNSDPGRAVWGVIAGAADEFKRMEDRIAALEAKLAEKAEEVESEPETEVKRGPGRPRKEMAVA